MTSLDLAHRTEDLRARRTPFVLATVVRVEAPTSAKPGDSAVVLPDGTLEGFVGGTCAESTVRLLGLRSLRSGESTLLRIMPGPDEVESGTATASDTAGLVTVANPCLSGGTMDIFLEVNAPPTLLYVFGDAPVARALVRLGEQLGYAVTATTDRDIAMAPDTSAVVVASHGRDEEPVLVAALRAGVPYVGLVASRKRGAAVVASLDVDASERARVHTPAGLDIGARTPGEIALSVLAQVVEGRPRVDPPVEAESAPADQATEAVDPICGMTVAVVPGALKYDEDGSTWYFCGPGCRQAFADQRERRVAGS
ncbi:MAG: YHS domain-containing protein [Streptosporangiales bacterium]|nr:YHS domain-containing protein [Streptosporangiales bacterium]